MRRVQVLTDKPYDVIIQRGILQEVAEHLEPFKKRALFLLTDENVDPLYGEHVFRRLKTSGFTIFRLVVPAGETSKSFETLAQVLEAMAGGKLHRDAVLIALGGGVVGDLGGFAAAIYLRGIDFIQIPTTLLAAVDSSVGGKTGINLEVGKNLAGAFHQPIAVFMDPDVLGTLPQDTFADGVAETLKYGILYDEPLFNRISEGLLPRDLDLDEIIARAVQHKADIVQSDERDKGMRQLLNLGHTFGHAIERVSRYEIAHGHAVAMGTAMMARACAKRGILSRETARDIEKALITNGLPTRTELSIEDLAEAAGLDKKAAGTEISLVVIEKIGQGRLHSIKLSELREWLEDSI